MLEFIQMHCRLRHILHGRLNLGPAWNPDSKSNGLTKQCNQQWECLEADISLERFSKSQQNTTSGMKNCPTRVEWLLAQSGQAGTAAGRKK